ncbi:MAG: hypothetical protein JST12_20115 [Armatimonadetes bacterium]|nr:hypothetical protein [Armatimonadota bacterium]
MLFGNKAEQYPHLVGYLRETENLDLFKDFHQQWSRIILACVGVPFLIGLAFHNSIPLILTLIVTALCGGVAGFFMQQKKAELYTPELESRLEAQRLFGTLRKMLTFHRLHRDLSESSLTLMDEIARTRMETRQLLESPYWRQPALAPTYVQLREQALTACDQAMNDAVMQFKMVIPTHVESRRPGDYVSEAMEMFLKTPKPIHQESGVGFDAAFKVADKLQLMRSELEKMTLQGERDTMTTTADIPGGMLDLTMSEIRTIRQAEEELRQGL